MTKNHRGIKMARVKLSEYITKQLLVCGRSQKEISEEIGYTKPNIITMFKQNKTKVPINKIKPLAVALGVDPVNMLRIAMLEYMPETWGALENVVGHAVSKNEAEMVELIRESIGDNKNDPRMTMPNQKNLLKKFAESL